MGEDNKNIIQNILQRHYKFARAMQHKNGGVYISLYRVSWRHSRYYITASECKKLCASHENMTTCGHVGSANIEKLAKRKHTLVNIPTCQLLSNLDRIQNSDIQHKTKQMEAY